MCVCVFAFSVEFWPCRLPKDLVLASAFSLEFCSAAFIRIFCLFLHVRLIFCFVAFPEDLLFASAFPLQFCFVVFIRILCLLLHFRLNFGYVVCLRILRFFLHLRLKFGLVVFVRILCFSKDLVFASAFPLVFCKDLVLASASSLGFWPCRCVQNLDLRLCFSFF